MTKRPEISVVIPTLNRANLVTRAVKSVLNQSFDSLEVIVVIDGQDEETANALELISNGKVRIIQLNKNRGPAGARNVGVESAKGKWIAFLDDDDEYLPDKLELQIECANQMNCVLPVVACQVIAHTPNKEMLWPRRFPEPLEPLSDYMLARKSLFLGEALIQTSMIFADKRLLIKIPFNEKLWRYEEWDWILRATKLPEVKLEFVKKPLAIWYVDDKRKSLSNSNDWQRSLDWIRSRADLVTPRAYSGFIVTNVTPLAVESSDYASLGTLLKEMIIKGEPKPIDFILFFGMWLVSRKTRRYLRSLMPFHRYS